MAEMTVWVGLAIAGIAFAAEYVDSTLGMGYGTMLTPVLIMAGYDPKVIVPAVLLSELFTGLLAGGLHHAFGNVSFWSNRKTKGADGVGDPALAVGGPSRALKVALLLAAFSVAGTLAAVCLAVSLSKFYLKLYIAVLVITIGVVILGTMGRDFGFSWAKVGLLGLVASFNKGMSGGGYGPVVTGGQLLAGVEGKSAIGITSLAEGLTCAVGLVAFALVTGIKDWTLAPWLATGAVLSVPLSAYTVKRINTRWLRVVIGVVTLLLGIATLVKVLV